MKSSEIGKIGEDLAAKYLESKKYRIIERNIRFRRIGEIDIIAEKIERKWLILAKKTVVFVEVKTIFSTENAYFIAEMHINRPKLERIKRLGMTYLSRNYGKLDVPWQIDVVAIEVNPGSGKTRIRHHENASL